MTRPIPASICLLALLSAAIPVSATPSRHARREAAPTSRVQSANRAALREPSRAGYVNAV